MKPHTVAASTNEPARGANRSRRRARLAATLLCGGAGATLVAGPAFAQATTTTTTPETVVVTGTKGDGSFGVKSGIPLEQMPQSVQVMGESEFIDRNVQSIGDIL